MKTLKAYALNQISAGVIKLSDGRVMTVHSALSPVKQAIVETQVQGMLNGHISFIEGLITSMIDGQEDDFDLYFEAIELGHFSIV